MRIVSAAGGAWVSGPSIGLGSRAQARGYRQ
jgi:hypothetical protein